MTNLSGGKFAKPARPVYKAAMNKWLFLAGVNGAAAVLMGAFAAHAMATRFPANAVGAVSTAAHYHLMHALALGLAALAARGKPKSWANIAALLFQIGIILFSGSLYLWALTGIRAFAFITPVGGTALVAGWVVLAMAAWKMDKT
jgi:uncharacterized membrane protein YgdD (TMEM256/DUF423 family)